MAKKNTVNMDALKACAVLSGFNWFKVTTKTAEKTEEFFGTGIIAQHDGAVIKIEKQFATPIYLAGFKAVTAEAANRFTFDMMDGVTAIIEGLEKDFADPNQYHNSKKAFKTVADLAEVQYINPDWTQYDKNNDTVIIVIDPFRMGLLTGTEEAQIKRIINVYLNGQSEEKQICRTICFKVKVNDPYKKIYADVFDLENNKPMNCAAPHIMQYNTNLAVSMKAAEVEKYNALYELAQSVTAAM